MDVHAEPDGQGGDHEDAAADARKGADQASRDADCEYAEIGLGCHWGEVIGACPLLRYLRNNASAVIFSHVGRKLEMAKRAPVKDKGYRDPERYRLHAEVCRVLTDPKRLMLLDVLREGEHSVGELAEELGSSLANASQHLAVLRSAGLVDTAGLARPSSTAWPNRN